tara:strand:- start:11320 stop:11571 length:252 start_codon:yes stop_codon:yes gene_type:complete
MTDDDDDDRFSTQAQLAGKESPSEADVKAILAGGTCRSRARELSRLWMMAAGRRCVSSMRLFDASLRHETDGKIVCLFSRSRG